MKRTVIIYLFMCLTLFVKAQELKNPSFEEVISLQSVYGAVISPDGKSILYYSHVDDTTSNYYLNERMFSIGIDGKNNKELGTDFDENISQLQWKTKGIYGVAWEKTKRTIVIIDPESGKVTKIPTGLDRIFGISFSKDASRLAYLGNKDNSLNEIFISDTDLESPKQLTNSTAQIDGWASLESEIISWKSEDGAIIEGVLHKPKDCDPNRKYPLLVAIHGGPTGST